MTVTISSPPLPACLHTYRVLYWDCHNLYTRYYPLLCKGFWNWLKGCPIERLAIWNCIRTGCSRIETISISSLYMKLQTIKSSVKLIVAITLYKSLLICHISSVSLVISIKLIHIYNLQWLNWWWIPPIKWNWKLEEYLMKVKILLLLVILSPVAWQSSAVQCWVDNNDNGDNYHYCTCTSQG